MPASMLTAHFSLDELVASQTAARLAIDNEPDEAALANLLRLAGVLEQVRALLGDKPILISSGYRCAALNDAVGGSTSSAHMAGLAADFTCPGYGTPHAIVAALAPHRGRLEVDQLIFEFGAWVHLGLSDTDPRCQCLTIDHNGTRAFV